MIKVVKGEFQQCACVSSRRHLAFLNQKHYWVVVRIFLQKLLLLGYCKGLHKAVILVSEFQQLIFKVVEIKNVL